MQISILQRDMHSHCIVTLFPAVKMAAVWWSESVWAPTPVCLNTWSAVSGAYLEEMCHGEQGLRFQRLSDHSQYVLSASCLQIKV